MSRLLWVSVLLATAPMPAQAGFIVGLVQAAISTVGGWLAAGGITAALTQAGISLLISTVATKLMARKAGQQDVFRELQQPSSLPVYRFVWGEGWAPGTPAPVRVKGERIYACYILNSRPSEGPFQLILDKRPVEHSGDPYNFSGPGAVGTNSWFEDHVTFWIGRGSQTSPPQRFLDEVPEFYEPADGWQGLTVIWIIFEAGGDDDFNERWPAAPPEVIVSGKWSKVWDPRDSNQDPDDPETWQWSNNPYLCALDTLRNNPVKPYPMEHLWLDTFIWGADDADAPLPVKEGGSIPRFRCDGVLTFEDGAEIEDQVSPILAAAAGRWLRAYGQLGVLPATYTEPVGTISEVLSEQDMVFERWRPGDQLFTEAYASFTSPDRAYESATTPVYKVAGAEAEDNTGPRPMKLDLPFVTDHRRGQYICKIEVMRTRMQKSSSFLAPPEAVNFLAGANINLALPAPYSSRNGIYKIEDSAPAEDPMGLSGEVALRCPMTVREESPAIYSWNPATEEQDMPIEDWDAFQGKPDAPASVSASSGAPIALASGNAVYPRIQFSFPLVNDARITTYLWEVQENTGPGPLQWRPHSNGFLRVEDLEDPAVAFSGPVGNGSEYRVSVRAVTRGGSMSEWARSNLVTATVGDSFADAPTSISAAPLEDGIAVTYRTPADPDFRYIEIYGSDTNNPTTASLIFGPLSPGVNTLVSRTETDLTDGQTRYYWARSIDHRGIASGFSTVMSATYEEV